MRIGVTGTRSGLRPYQYNGVYEFLSANYTPDSELHHGDCVGVDVEVARMAKDLGYEVVCHPPIDESLRAYFKQNDKVLIAKTHFARNRDIVDSVDFLIVIPGKHHHRKRVVHGIRMTTP